MKRQDFYSEVISQIAAVEAKYGYSKEIADRDNFYILVNEQDWVGVCKDFFTIENSFSLGDDSEWRFLGIKIIRTINKLNPTLVVELNKK